MSLELLLQRHIDSEKLRRPLDPDPAAELILLLKDIFPSKPGMQPWEIAEIIRLRNFRNLDLFEQLTYQRGIDAIVTTRMKSHGIKSYSFLNRDDAGQIIAGTKKPFISSVLQEQDWSTPALTDLFFENGSIRVQDVIVQDRPGEEVK